MSNTYVVWELAIGAGLACVALLIVILCIKESCAPVLECFDHVPLYVVVAAYATVMTIKVTYQILASHGGV